MWKALAYVALFSTASHAGPTDKVAGWTADTIPWQSAAPNGTKFALLEGNREKAYTAFSYAFYIPASVWDSPHYHSATARVFVAKGTLKIGYGTVTNRGQAKSYPAGSYVIVPAGTVHFDGSDEDTIIIGTAIGPWTTTYLDGSSPASAGTPSR
ncbi:quercetin dioxygenase-like cupin family protein [Sphingomonas vulcanisoli]|uniref:Quercetin dioxygenase-like cupin family protein n=1 Tax=Sphingomonas vulcanisoli TaxID=1658060 RepID=A0ABX0TTT9_9SPHN|nr:cupin domain-containing protein [Sphingomonas vulcanisoli]NIJ08871.1 quercetin dioxygenase-like cupin family protein [Sphingomonas vulcanisoli]